MSKNLKPTKRKAFNFLRSYFDVLNELEKDDDKLNFLLSIINKQFLDEDPKDLNFIVNLCYESQRHAIESSVKGWKRVNKEDPTTNTTTNPTTYPPTNPTTNHTTDPKEEEEEVEVKEEEQEEVKVEKFSMKKSLCSLGVSNEIINDYLAVRKLKKLANTEAAFNKLVEEINKTELEPKEVIKICAEKSWGGFSHKWLIEEKEKSFAKKEIPQTLEEKYKHLL